MSREIKFRWWDRNHKRIIQSDCLLINANGKTITEWVKIGDYDYLLVAGENADLMQFTGLLDKKGKEIYEGDLIKIDGHGRIKPIIQVKWIAEKACFGFEASWVDEKNDNQLELYMYHNFKEEIMTIEIIGNIYENPELLEAR